MPGPSAREGRRTCEELAADLGETVNIAILDGDRVVNISQVRGAGAITSYNWVGQGTPLHATSSGKVLLAHLEGARQAELVGRELDRFTPHTHADPAVLEEELRSVLELGYAVTYGELELGLNAVAVPVHDEDGRVIAALSASGPAYRLSPERIAEVLSQLVATAADLSRRMGHWGSRGLSPIA